MDPCKEHEPQVINHTMIARCLEDQGLKGELGRLAREEGIPWDEVLQIRLEFMHILRIDHLWVLPALTSLSLSNNLIEELENIDMLVNLKELDLSFNKIKRIMNIDKLIHLEILNFFSNLIEKIENMDTFKDLVIFSIGKNQITDRNNVLYLRRFKKLKSVNMAGNPCAENAGFRIFVATFLPQITYYQYKLVDETERDEGNKMYSKELLDLEAIEMVIREKQEKIEAEEAEAEFHSESFVEFLGSDHLFNQMFENDTEGKLLLKIGDDAKEYYNELETQFMSLGVQIFENGQAMYKVRKQEVEQFMEITEGAKNKNQLQGIDTMEEFMEIKNEIFNKIEADKASYDNKELTLQEFNENVTKSRKPYFNQIHQTWKILMNREITLFEQLEETNQTFEQTLTEMVNNFIEMAQGFFAMMRSAEGTYTEQITDIAVRLLTAQSLAPDPHLSPEIHQILTDRDTLNNVIATSHDTHLLAIDNREDRLVRRARAWLNNLVNDLQKNEIIRNRAKILEINHYLDIQRDEFGKISVIEEKATEL